MRQISDLLIACGLNSSEQDILLFLLQSGATPGSLIARRKGLKRTTAYSVLQSLEKRGLVIREKTGSATNFVAVNPELIVSILEKHARHNYENVVQASSQLLEPLTFLAKTSRQVTFGAYAISATESEQAIQALLYDILTKESFVAIFDIDMVCITPPLKDLIDRFLVSTAKSKNHIRDIVVEGKHLEWYIKNIRNKNHRVKYIPKHYSIPTDVILSAGVVFQTSYETNQEMVIQIKHQAYYRTMMTIFDMLWDYLPEDNILH